MIPTDIGKGRGGIRSLSENCDIVLDTITTNSQPGMQRMYAKGLNVWYEIRCYLIYDI